MNLLTIEMIKYSTYELDLQTRLVHNRIKLEDL